MTNRTDFIERRKYKRFRVKEGAFATIMAAPVSLGELEDLNVGEIALAVLKAKPAQMGPIVNISNGGLSFRYIDKGKELNASYLLNILFTQDAFHLKNITVKIVSDFDAIDEFPFSTIIMKQAGVQFGELDSIQRAQLDQFIRNYTIDEV